MFEWKDKYSCGIKRVDDEHKKLFEIGQSIYSMIKKEDNQIFYIDEILDSIDELRKYTIYHFEDEERLMQLYEYPGYKQQKLVHDKFIEKIESIDESDIEKNPEEEVIKLLDFVYKWISEHILGMDLKLKDYFDNLRPSKLVKNTKKF
ncbi:bacteriohemerythrin [Clostridium tyrobutyricum]|jgi:hemerythrin|uniref:Hemerythrin-like metal-binding domain protein n=1 Tax=Clostridium tyrobutyricum DIVETGP TaxID=1408889 RepID=W6NFE0_CLOTY|nr:hemerythrin family protein [Clostridium tyrobutyricum]AND84770.1 hemerythrin related protein [Clostridium tyrobutyricum]ANP69360.1 bacteriohemerythrin [Clostridium tyrobutyricum]MBR9647658.1 hemerythrin family protein [Clostridium tyrobutyricum]MBV4417096.1 hemerythrin family protein [Clostridium tyrobutyricum]MBV4423339.1 hemerythrin family protein [Clostridium tyrobutyricum]